MKIQLLRGAEIVPYVDQIVELCHMIYREYPYLYNGTDADYRAYLESYAQSDDSIICLALHGNKAVGLAAGVPMSKTRDLYKQPLLENGYDLNTLFYLGEFGLKPEYRKEEIEMAMYQKLEFFAWENNFKALCIWEVNNPSNTTPKPADYTPIDNFLKQLRFSRHSELNFHIFWTNINDVAESSHLATYWLKSLN